MLIRSPRYSHKQRRAPLLLVSIICTQSPLHGIRSLDFAVSFRTCDRLFVRSRSACIVAKYFIARSAITSETTFTQTINTCFIGSYCRPHVRKYRKRNFCWTISFACKQFKRNLSNDNFQPQVFTPIWPAVIKRRSMPFRAGCYGEL